MQISLLFYSILSPISPSSSHSLWSLPERKSCFNTSSFLPPSLPHTLPSFFLPSFLHCLSGNTLHTLWNNTWLGCVLPSQTRAKLHAAIWPIPVEGERREIEAGPMFPRHVSHPPGGDPTLPSSLMIESRMGWKKGNKEGRGGQGKRESGRSDFRRGKEEW